MLVQLRSDSVNDELLLSFLQIGMHWEADDLRREPLADREAVAGDRIIPIGSLQVQGLGVIDRGGNATRFKARRESSAARGGNPNRVLGPN